VHQQLVEYLADFPDECFDIIVEVAVIRCDDSELLPAKENKSSEMNRRNSVSVSPTC